MSKQEREICKFEILNKFCLHFNLCNDNFCLKGQVWKRVWIWRGLVWKRVWKTYIFWSEIGSGFEELGGTPPPRISRSTPPPSPPVEPHDYHIYYVNINFLSLSRRRSFVRDVPSGEGRGETADFAGYKRKGSTTNIIQHIGVHMQVSWYLAWHFTLIIREPKTRKKYFENSNNEKNKNMSPDMGLEPMTLRLKVWCSTDWANRAAHTES